MNDTIIRILVWGLIVVAFGFIYYSKFKGKKKYKDVEFQVDENWFENSRSQYPADSEVKDYFFHYDKNYVAQGHILEDENHQTVYEIKKLYNNGMGADETDFVNHILNITHHHKVGKVVTLSGGFGNFGVTVNSSYKFDGKDIFQWLEDKGYSFRFHLKGMAFIIDIMKDGEKVGTIYSSNNGKNLYERNGQPVEAKMGGKGYYVLECAYDELDAVVLYAMTFARVDFDLKMSTILGK